MQKFLFMPDSFKGTLSSEEICSILTASAYEHIPGCKCQNVPIADGGEGTIDCFLNIFKDSSKVNITVKDAFLHDIATYYGHIDNETAVIEVASCAGLPQAGSRANPSITSSFGVGEQITHALNQGYKTIILALGGSSTNDGGCGIACALGAVFKDKNNNKFMPVGKTLVDIAHIDVSNIDKRIYSTNFIAMCDVDCTLYGKNGAAYVFGPQKGADLKMVEDLDLGLRNLATVLKSDLNLDVSSIRGGGAAGGIGAGIHAFLNAHLKRGVDVILDLISFDSLVKSFDVVFTGEGRTDSQSLQGKVIRGIANRAKVAGKPVIVISGGVCDDEIQDIYKLGVCSVFTVNRLPESFEISRYRSKENLKYTADNLFRLLNLTNQTLS